MLNSCLAFLRLATVKWLMRTLVSDSSSATSPCVALIKVPDYSFLTCDTRIVGRVPGVLEGLSESVCRELRTVPGRVRATEMLTALISFAGSRSNACVH